MPAIETLPDGSPLQATDLVLIVRPGAPATPYTVTVAELLGALGVLAVLTPAGLAPLNTTLLPTTPGGAGAIRLWNNGGALCIG